MNPIRTSRIAPVVTQMRFRGILEGAYLLRLLLQQKSNLATRAAMVKLFGAQWGAVTQEKLYFELISTYVLWHHQTEYFDFLKTEGINYKANDLRAARIYLVRYLTEVQGLGGMSEIVNDLDQQHRTDSLAGYELESRT